MRLLFVSPADLTRPRGGRAMLAALHHDALSQLCGDGFRAHRLDHASAGIWSGMRGYLDGATPAGIAAVVAAIREHAADAIWLDGSNLGRIAQAVRAACPNLRILTFYHNVEARFFLGALRRQPRPRAAGVLVGNYIAERLATRHSHDVIALSERDSVGLDRLYGRAATDFLPMAITDQLTAPPPETPVPADAPLLFVGGAFYANIAGILWFAREVAPHIDLPVIVVGHGMETIRAEVAHLPNVRVVGAVDALEPYYLAARAVIAPIFDGSGMKTKVAEALMFGRPIIGTPEAFSGYEAIAVRAGWVCGTVAEFRAAIDAATARPLPNFDHRLRALYDRHHSPAATRNRLAVILQPPTARG